MALGILAGIPVRDDSDGNETGIGGEVSAG
jgi:hypothetical protein